MKNDAYAPITYLPSFKEMIIENYNKIINKLGILSEQLHIVYPYLQSYCP